EPLANGSLIVRSGSGLVRKLLPELCREEEARIGRHPVNPLPAQVRAERLVKRSIDFDRVEKLGQVAGLVEVARPPRRINDSAPVRVGPSGWAYANRAGRVARFDGLGHGLLEKAKASLCRVHFACQMPRARGNFSPICPDLSATGLQA